jgi:hypothetical protein
MQCRLQWEEGVRVHIRSYGYGYRTLCKVVFKGRKDDIDRYYWLMQCRLQGEEGGHRNIKI